MSAGRQVESDRFGVPVVAGSEARLLNQQLIIQPYFDRFAPGNAEGDPTVGGDRHEGIGVERRQPSGVRQFMEIDR